MDVTTAAFLFALLLPGSPASTGDLHPTFCLCNVVIDGGRASLCSPTPVSHRRQTEIERQLDLALRLYPWFARKAGLTPSNEQHVLRIYLLPVAVLNDHSIFTAPITGRIVGRYTRGRHHIYVTPEMFTRAGATDLAHEVAHYGNDTAGVPLDGLHTDRDERLAMAFEDFVVSSSDR